MKRPSETEIEYLTVAEVSALLRVTRATIWRRVKDRSTGFPLPRQTGSRLLFAKSEIVAWVERQPRGILAPRSAREAA